MDGGETMNLSHLVMYTRYAHKAGIHEIVKVVLDGPKCLLTFNHTKIHTIKLDVNSKYDHPVDMVARELAAKDLALDLEMKVAIKEKDKIDAENKRVAKAAETGATTPRSTSSVQK